LKSAGDFKREKKRTHTVILSLILYLTLVANNFYNNDEKFTIAQNLMQTDEERKSFHVKLNTKSTRKISVHYHLIVL
jgi:hypothetical protein